MPLKINKKEYERLFHEKMDNKTYWKLRNNLCVNSLINEIFDENNFLKRIIFDNKYNILKNENHHKGANILYKCIGNLDISDFDHYYTVTFKNNVSRIDVPETISGVMNFPYINDDWSWIERFIHKTPNDWSVFIINPILMRYQESSVGIFLTPTYGKNNNITDFNEFIKSKTGYPFFLNYTDEENIEKINYDKPKLTLENYIEEMKKIGKNRGLSKLLDFWANNECVKVSSFEYSFKDYMDNLPFSVWDNINFKEIRSFTPFELIHEETGENLGPFHKFALDKSFKLADTDKGVLKLTDKQINDLIEGKYDFKLLQ